MRRPSRGPEAKRLLPALLLVCSMAQTCLLGASYKANSLGQNIDALEGPSIYKMEDSDASEAALPQGFGLDGGGFSASSRTLYKDGKPWKRFDSFAKGQVLVEAVWDGKREDLESLSCYERGFLTRRGDGAASTEYVYDEEGRLVRAIHLKDGRLSSTDLHYRGADGNLAMVRTIRLSEARDLLISDSFLYEDGQLVTSKAALDLEKEAAGARTEGQMLVFSSVSPGGVTTETTMDEKGRVVRIERKSGENVLSSEERSYSEAGALASSIKTEAGTRTASEYKDGSLAKQTRWENGEIVLVNLFENGQKRQTLYEFGEPYAVVVSDSLTGKVKKVEYL